MFKDTFHHSWYPFQNQAEIDRVRKITFEDIVAMNGKHPTNPNIQLDVLPVDQFETVMITDMLKRIIESDRLDKKCVMIMCNPCPTYRKVAYMLHQLKVNCRNVKFYMMDEWADEDGNIAPLSYKAGFGNAFYRFMVSQIMDLGFKEENFIYHSNKVTPDFSKMLEQDGEADIVYSGPGWPGHLAFIDPVEDWFCDSMEEYCAQGAKVASLHPLTIAQNSLHGAFGCSGDISRVPPKGAMMWPRDAMKAKEVLDMHGITTAGSHVTWQRLTSRLAVFGEPTQEVPASILQLRDNPTRVIMSESLSATIREDDYFQY
jgi:6-phosphogluconolactonase/glucosamine-6-phosphate isomerase/deaminase